MKSSKLFYFASSIFFILFSSCTKVSAPKEKVPSRIVCLSPSGAEILCDIGAFDKIVAKTDFCDYPEQMNQIPSVGGFDGKTLSIETIISYKPDFVYGSKGMHDFIASPLENMGIRVYLSDPQTIDLLIEEIEEISKMTGHIEEGQISVNNLKSIFNELTVTTNSSSRPSIYYEVWYEPFMSAGNKSFINDLIYKAGGINIFFDINESYPTVSEEAIIARQPEIILVPIQNGLTDKTICTRPAWQSVPAIINNRVILVDANIMSRPSPRIGQAAIELNKLINQ